MLHAEKQHKCTTFHFWQIFQRFIVIPDIFLIFVISKMLQINSRHLKTAIYPGIARLLSSSQCPGPPTQPNPVALGQPHPTTHPHLFDAVDQVNPGISREEFQSRRNGLAGAVLRHFKETQTSRNKLRSYGLNAPPDEPNSHLIVVPAGPNDSMYGHHTSLSAQIHFQRVDRT